MGFKEPSLADRQQAAAKARQAALENLRSKTGANDANFSQRQEKLKAVREGRETRAAERETHREQRQKEKAAAAVREREAAEVAKREAAARAEHDKAEKAKREAERQAEGKAARDAKYAKRKARSK